MRRREDEDLRPRPVGPGDRAPSEVLLIRPPAREPLPALLNRALRNSYRFDNPSAARLVSPGRSRSPGSISRARSRSMRPTRTRPRRENPMNAPGGRLALAKALVILLALGGPLPAAAQAVKLTVGYQPYDTISYSAVVIRGLELWKKHLPPGSTVE